MIPARRVLSDAVDVAPSPEDVARSTLGVEPGCGVSIKTAVFQISLDKLLPLRNIEKILMPPRRRLVRVRLAGVPLRLRDDLTGPLPSAERSTTRIFSLSREVNSGLCASFLFRVAIRDIISEAR